jgi:serine protease Do
MFPVTPRPDEIDERGLCVVQDPNLRSKILPLFSFDPRASGERPVGQGTAFRIDPWSQCATAFHVVEDLFEPNEAGASLALKPNLRLAALEMNGLVFGQMPIPSGAWRPLSGAFSIFGIETPPLMPARLRNVTELMALGITPSAVQNRGTPFLRVNLGRWRPSLGERVLALGFADLDVGEADAPDDRPMKQYLYGAYGEVIDIEGADGSRGRPWPQIRVAANWPGGMSGGPVFNEAGEVIGLVSAGIGGQGVSTATFFSGWDVPRRIFSSLDPLNAGSFYCHAVFDGKGEVALYGQDRGEVERFARENGLADLSRVSINPATGDYMRL